MREHVNLTEGMTVSSSSHSGLVEKVTLGRASMTVTHRRPTHFLKNDVGVYVPDPKSYVLVDEPETVWNLITRAGRIFLHTQGYGTAGLGVNGLNYIALSNDVVTETDVSTVLSNEIVANGLSRAQGTVTLPVGAGTQTTIDKTFTCSVAPQAAQKAALFTLVGPPPAGTMNHVLGFTQRSLQINDTLQITFTITLGA